MLQLGVNIDHVTTLRQARGTPYPDPLEAAVLCKQAGAHGLTVHLREDRRHIQDEDVRRLKAWNGLPLNLEMATTDEMLAFALDVMPDEVCLVPERREELTTEGGLNLKSEQARVAKVCDALAEKKIAVSLFIDPNEEQINIASALKVPIIELHTGAYCDASEEGKDALLAALVVAAEHAAGKGLRVNAGHGINLENIEEILKIPHLHTLNIGHSIVCRSVFVGLEEAVKEMLLKM